MNVYGRSRSKASGNVMHAEMYVIILFRRAVS